MPNPNDVTPASGRAAQLAAWHKWRGRIYRGYAAGVGIAIAAAFLESFHNQIAWFNSVGFHGFYGWIAPAMIDIFILGGEGLLLVAVMEHWNWAPKVAAWSSIIGGLVVSVAANLGAADIPATPHAAGAAAAIASLKAAAQGIPLKQMLSYAAAPVAMAGLSALGLMIVKRAFRVDEEGLPDLPEQAGFALFYFRDALETGRIPSVQVIKKTVGCAQPRAIEIRDYLRLLRAQMERFADEADSDGEGARGRTRSGGLPRPTSPLPVSYLNTDGNHSEVVDRGREG